LIVFYTCKLAAFMVTGRFRPGLLSFLPGGSEVIFGKLLVSGFTNPDSLEQVMLPTRFVIAIYLIDSWKPECHVQTNQISFRYDSTKNDKIQ